MNLPHLKLITQGGGKMKEELFVQYANFCKENGKRFIATYGQTEGAARMAFLPADLSIAKTGSIGRAIPGGQLSLLQDDGSETTEGEATGEMIYRGPNVTLGYAQSQNDLKIGDVFNGVLATGDLAKRDADGYYFILGRLKRFLKLYGLRIGLDECEWLISNEFNTECLCAGNDEKMQVYITDANCKDLIKPFLSAKTGLFIKAIEVIVVEEIPRAMNGKPILNVV
jgi:acyl-coenzyme A synthetase/AMP-(fatty) acid ligase